jgi:hypothetical protein
VEQSRGGHALKKVVKPYGLVMPGVRAIVRTVSGMPVPPGMPSKDCEAGGGPPKMIPPDGRAGPDCMARGSAYQEETVIGEEGRIITCEDLMCMREGNTIRGIVILGLLLVIMVSGAAAQPKISSTPAAITLAQTNHYWFSSLPRAGEWTAEKNLVLDATDNITGLSFWPPDISQEDGRYSLDPGSVNVTITNETLAALKADGVAGIAVTFLFGRGTQAGKYTGDLLFTYSDDTGSRGTLTVPVTLSMKDNPAVPLLFLLLSTGVGVLYFLYREKGRPYDVFMLELDRFREIMDRDREFQELPLRIYLRRKILTEMEEIALDLGKPDLESAQVHLGTVKGVWGEWLIAKGDLPLVLRKQGELLESLPRLEKQDEAVLGGDLLFLDGLDLALRRILEALLIPMDSAGFQGALKTFRADLVTAGDNCRAFQDLVEKVRRTEEYCRAQTPPNQECLGKVQACKMKLRQVPYGKVSIAECTLSGYLPVTAEEAPKGGSPAESERQRWLGIWGALSWSSRRVREGTIGPATRLRLFSMATFLILVGILVATGYKELYDANATFGSIPDYIAVILWGFGVGTGSEAFTTALTNFASVKLGWPA